MAQFDIYQNSDSASSTTIPFLLDVQHDLHQTLITRLVIPLIRLQAMQQSPQKICPCFTIQGVPVVLSTPEMAGYPVRNLGVKIDSLAEHRSDILAAIDFLLSGF